MTPPYDLHPTLPAGNRRDLALGWGSVADRLCQGAPQTIVIEAYPGVRLGDLAQLSQSLGPARVFDAGSAMRSPGQLASLTFPDVGDDPVFGYITRLHLEDFFDPGLLAQMRGQITGEDGRVVVIGTGASLVTSGDILVYADLPRREAVRRQRDDALPNLGLDNRDEPSRAKYKRGYFVDWRVADRHKQALWGAIDFFLDTCSAEPKLITANAVFRALKSATQRPFRVVPYFDPAPWGGTWLQRTCGVGSEEPNLGWCFDCVPEENSLLLEFGGITVELPALDLVLREPKALLGEAVYGRYGAEFPIRTDVLDTMNGGNLSLQVHPLARYIAEHFGMTYAQDESYYVLAAASDAVVHLGVVDDVDAAEMASALRRSAATGEAFAHQRYVNRFGARQHDHFLIPAGTLHGSGANTVVMEISSTPYLFTFKLHDWNRPDLDGRRRPLHIDHGMANLARERSTAYCREHLINQVSEVARGKGWVEERTGLHPAEAIETRRHWFRSDVPHLANGRFAVVSLVEGEDVVIQSQDGGFDPFQLNYAETAIVPAQAGSYLVRPGASASGRWATVKAFSRTEA